MQALEYRPSPARYAAARLTPRIATASLHLVDRRAPALPTADWEMVRPRLAGICGSDHALLEGRASLYLSPLTSTPFVPGHEVVGELRRGQRVVIDPALGCEARGVDPTCVECMQARPALCREVIVGEVSAGLQIGFCRDTGGGWSEALVAHRSQIHAVADILDDEDAVLVEPLACSLHATARAELEPAASVAVIGAGTIGLLTIAALRDRDPGLTILAVVKHRGQELAARRMGADEVCGCGELHLTAARLTRARRLVGRGLRELLLGGLDAVLDCVGSGASLQDAVTTVRPRGKVVLVGMAGRVEVDLALAWQREVEIRCAYGCGDEFGAALALAETLRPGHLVADGWPLRDHRIALVQSRRAARSGHVKTVFDLRPGT